VRASRTGGCLCGGVRFEITEPLLGAGYCHCTRCQRRTGTAASVNAELTPGSVRVLAGDGLIREYVPDSGSAKVFCGACGGPLWSARPDGTPGSVRFGALDEAPDVHPTYRQFTAYAAAWDEIPDDGLPRFPERRS
jgi:hypothetical protein